MQRFRFKLARPAKSNGGDLYQVVLNQCGGRLWKVYVPQCFSRESGIPRKYIELSIKLE